MRAVVYSKKLLSVFWERVGERTLRKGKTLLREIILRLKVYTYYVCTLSPLKL